MFFFLSSDGVLLQLSFLSLQVQPLGGLIVGSSGMLPSLVIWPGANLDRASFLVEAHRMHVSGTVSLPVELPFNVCSDIGSHMVSVAPRHQYMLARSLDLATNSRYDLTV